MSESYQLYGRLLTYLRGKIGMFSLSLIGFALFAASQPALAKLMELVIESIENKDSDARLFLPTIAVGIFIMRGVGYFIGNYYNEYVGASIIRQIKLQLFNHLTTVPAAYFDANKQGNILHSLHNSVSLLQVLVTTAFKTLVREGLTIIALVGYVFYLNWKLSLVFLCIAPVLAYMVAATNQTFRSISRKNEGALGKALQVSKELISNHGVVRTFGSQDYESARYESAVNRAFKTQLKIRKVASIFTPLTQVVIAMAMAFIIYLLLSPETLAKSTTGELVGYLTAVALLPKSIRSLSGISVTIQRGLVGAEVVFKLVDVEPEPDLGEHEADVVKGKLEVKNLRFTYPNSETEVLKNISFTVQPGEMIALVGKSGSGKSTLANLLFRLYEIDDDSIFLDDVDINRYKLANLRGHMSAVNQNISLFDDTIRNNIAYGKKEYSDEQIYRALECANALEFVAALPKGLDTAIGENGLKLSGGQRQRISIARAFLKDSPVLILDEATSALDNESEALVTSSLDQLANAKTTLVIAHRLSTIIKADRLLVMRDGEIVETGSHAELVKKNRFYASLYQTEYQNREKSVD